jgi:hypothetical protein
MSWIPKTGPGGRFDKPFQAKIKIKEVGVEKMRFEIRTKRRVYVVYVEFHGEQYELVFGKRRKTIGGWEQIPIVSNPLEFAHAEVKKFELKEDYIDALDDKFFLWTKKRKRQPRRNPRMKLW